MTSYIRLTQFLTTNVGDSRSLHLCQSCGAVVADKEHHDTFHRRLDRIEGVPR